MVQSSCLSSDYDSSFEEGLFGQPLGKSIGDELFGSFLDSTTVEDTMNEPLLNFNDDGTLARDPNGDPITLDEGTTDSFSGINQQALNENGDHVTDEQAPDDFLDFSLCGFSYNETNQSSDSYTGAADNEYSLDFGLDCLTNTADANANDTGELTTGIASETRKSFAPLPDSPVSGVLLDASSLNAVGSPIAAAQAAHVTSPQTEVHQPGVVSAVVSQSDGAHAPVSESENCTTYNDMLIKYTTMTEAGIVMDTTAVQHPDLWQHPDPWYARFRYNICTGRIVCLKGGGLAFAGLHYPTHPTNEYKYLPAQGTEEGFDQTSYHEDHDLSTHNEVNLPLPCAFIDERSWPASPNTMTKPENLIGRNGKPVRGPNKEILRHIEVLPRWISTAVEGWRLHYWFVKDRRIKYTDIISRMSYRCNENGGEGPLAEGLAAVSLELQDRVDEFRANSGILPSMSGSNYDDDYEVTLEDRKAVSKLTKIQLEYGVWWTVDEKRGIMYPPKPSDPNVPYNYDFYLLPMKRCLDDRIEEICSQVNCKKSYPVELLDPAVTLHLQSQDPMTQHVPTLPAQMSHSSHSASPARNTITGSYQSPVSTPKRNATMLGTARGPSQMASMSTTRGPAAPSRRTTSTTPKARPSNAAVPTPPASKHKRKRSSTSVKSTGTPSKRSKIFGLTSSPPQMPPTEDGPIAQVFGDSTPPEQRARLHQAILQTDFTRRSIDQCLEIPWLNMDMAERAHLLLPIFNGETPREAESNEQKYGASFGARRQREALEKAINLRQQAEDGL